MNKEYEDFLVQKYEKTGVCDDAPQLVAVLKRYHGNRNVILSALRSYRDFTIQLRYTEVYDNIKTAECLEKCANNRANATERFVYTWAASLFREKFYREKFVKEIAD